MVLTDREYPGTMPISEGIWIEAMKGLGRESVTVIVIVAVTGYEFTCELERVTWMLLSGIYFGVRVTPAALEVATSWAKSFV